MEIKKQKRLSIAELKNIKGFENLSDEEAEHAIASIEKFAILFFELYQKHKKESHKIIQLIPDNKLRKEDFSDEKERRAA